MTMADTTPPNIDFSAFFKLTPDLVWIAGKDGYLKKVNKAVVEKLGYTEAELYANPITSFIYPEDIGKTIESRKKLFSGEVLHNFNNRYVTKKGSVVWLEWTSVYFSDKEIVLAIAKDITTRKQIEKEVEEKYQKFKSLAAHFKTSIENDKKYIAYELHEELAQLVSVVNMDVGWLNNNLAGQPEKVREKIDHTQAVSRMLIKTLQRLSFAISPQMLDDFGLDATMKWLCKEFTVLNGIPCFYEYAYAEELLTGEMKIDFFRICQESLNNVLNHSVAGGILIRIEDTGEKIQLRIIDNGTGFITMHEKQEAGLASIRERAASINGRLSGPAGNNYESGICVTVEKQYLHLN